MSKGQSRREQKRQRRRRRGGAPKAAVRSPKGRVQVLAWVCHDPSCWACTGQLGAPRLAR